jgi:hypothetical protein
MRIPNHPKGDHRRCEHPVDGKQDKKAALPICRTMKKAGLMKCALNNPQLYAQRTEVWIGAHALRSSPCVANCPLSRAIATCAKADRGSHGIAMSGLRKARPGGPS